MEELYGRYKDKGLVLVGLNSSDEPRIGIDFLRKHAVSFPNIVDPSSEAKAVSRSAYQTIPGMGAVPLSYLIDAEGKVVAAWYGGHEAARVKKLLEGLLSR